MTRGKFNALFIALFTGIYLGLTYIIEAEKLAHFIVVWVLAGYYFGQYSMRFRKE